MKNRSFVGTLAKCLCMAVLVLGFTLSTVGCSEQTGDSATCAGKCCPKAAGKCPPGCKKPCCAKKASTDAAKPADKVPTKATKAETIKEAKPTEEK